MKALAGRVLQFMARASAAGDPLREVISQSHESGRQAASTAEPAPSLKGSVLREGDGVVLCMSLWKDRSVCSSWGVLSNQVQFLGPWVFYFIGTLQEG